MKSYIWLTATIMLFAATMQGCKKEDIKSTAEKQMEEPTVAIGGEGAGQKPYIVFETTAEYDDYEAMDDADRELFVANYKATYTNFISLEDFATNVNYQNATYSSDPGASRTLVDSVDAVPLQRVLNPDGVVQIADKILYLNVNNQLCYMLDVHYPDEYGHLISGNLTNGHITTAGFDEDVVDIIDGYVGRCSGTGRSGRTGSAETPIHSGYSNGDPTLYNIKIQVSFEYKTWAVWFRLREGSVRFQQKIAPNVNQWISTAGPIAIAQVLKYVKKCNAETGEDNVRVNAYNSSSLQYTPYEGNRGLIKYDWKIWSRDYYNWSFNGTFNNYGPYIFSAGY